LTTNIVKRIENICEEQSSSQNARQLDDVPGP
jgi:hypothetical protein